MRWEETGWFSLAEWTGCKFRDKEEIIGNVLSVVYIKRRARNLVGPHSVYVEHISVNRERQKKGGFVIGGCVSMTKDDVTAVGVVIML